MVNSLIFLLGECLSLSRAILRCSKLGIDVPALYLVDMPNHSIYMENVDGLTVREIIESYDLEKDAEKVQSVAQKVLVLFSPQTKREFLRIILLGLIFFQIGWECTWSTPQGGHCPWRLDNIKHAHSK